MACGFDRSASKRAHCAIVLRSREQHRTARARVAATGEPPGVALASRTEDLRICLHTFALLTRKPQKFKMLMNVN